MANGKSKLPANFTCKYKVTSIGLKYDDRHAEIPKYRVPYEARPPLTSFNKRMDHYIIGKLLEEEKVDIFDVQKAVEENYPDFEDQEFDVTKGQGPWTNEELLDEICLSDDASEGLKYLGKRTHYLSHKNFT